MLDSESDLEIEVDYKRHANKANEVFSKGFSLKDYRLLIIFTMYSMVWKFEKFSNTLNASLLISILPLRLIKRLDSFLSVFNWMHLNTSLSPLKKARSSILFDKKIFDNIFDQTLVY